MGRQDGTGGCMDEETGDRMTFSIVVTTYNRRDVLKNLLIRLEQQTDLDFEVIVAMDGCTDGTTAMLERHHSPYPIRWVDTKYTGYGLALARNAGILSASEGVVAIIDDDSIPVPGFVAAHRAAVAPRCITGGPRNPYDSSRDTRLAAKMIALAALPPVTPMSIPHIRTTYPNAWLVENNVSMIRSDWIELGLFTERLRIYGVIGQEFFARAEHLGWRYQYAPSAGVVHREDIEGDNGLSRARKTSDVRRAAFLLPGLMTPRQYEAQCAWAHARASNSPAPSFPSWQLSAGVKLMRKLPRSIARYLIKSARL